MFCSVLLLCQSKRTPATISALLSSFQLTTLLHSICSSHPYYPSAQQQQPKPCSALCFFHVLKPITLTHAVPPLLANTQIRKLLCVSPSSAILSANNILPIPLLSANNKPVLLSITEVNHSSPSFPCLPRSEGPSATACPDCRR